VFGSASSGCSAAWALECPWRLNFGLICLALPGAAPETQTQFAAGDLPSSNAAKTTPGHHAHYAHA